MGGSSGTAIYLRTNTGSIGQINFATSDLTIRTRQATPILFNVNNSEKLRIGTSGEIGIGGATYGSSGQVLTSGGSGANATWTTISAAPEFTATASGAIANGKTIVLNSDATVSVAATTLTSESIGSVSGIESATKILNSTWISDTQFVVAWSLQANPKYVYMAVGTVSGTTITYGTAAQFPNNAIAHSAGLIWDTSVNAGFIALADNWESKFYAYGFTISGTTVSVRAHASSGYVQDSGEKRCIRAASNGKGEFAFVYITSSSIERLKKLFGRSGIGNYLEIHQLVRSQK